MKSNKNSFSIDYSALICPYFPIFNIKKSLLPISTHETFTLLTKNDNRYQS